MKFSNKDFFSKCDHIRSDFIFCAVTVTLFIKNSRSKYCLIVYSTYINWESMLLKMKRWNQLRSLSLGDHIDLKFEFQDILGL